MDYDIQCSSLLVNNLRLPHKFENKHVHIKEYITEEMNTCVPSIPETYDYQNLVILRPIQKWILKKKNDSDDIDIGSSVSGTNDPFCFTASGTTMYIVTANPQHIPLSTEIVRYAFYYAGLKKNKLIQINSLVLDPDIIDFKLEVKSVLYEHETYNMEIEVSLNEPTTEILKVIVETSDTSKVSISGTSILSFNANEKNTSGSVIINTLDITNRQNPGDVYPTEIVYIRLRVITPSRNCQIMQKLFPITITDKPTLSNLKWEKSVSGTIEDWERVFVTDTHEVVITFNSNGPFLSDTEMPAIIIKVGNNDSETITLDGNVHQYPLLSIPYQHNYTWTYKYKIKNVQNGEVDIQFEERDWYNIE